ncbi:unnamed protein product [Sphagnum jensenii]
MDLVMLITVAGLLCQVECLTGHSRTSHQHKSNPSLSPTWPPAESPGSSSVVDLGPSAFPFSPIYVPSEGPSELFPFMAPSPLVVPVVSSPPPPMLTGHCPLNFSAVDETLKRTAADCPEPLALYLGSVICCPQLESVMQVSLGQHSLKSGTLALNSTEAEFCFSDTLSLLISLGANSSVAKLCSAQPANLTGGLCPVMRVKDFLQLVNTTRFLEACQSVDPLKECTEEPVCQPVLNNIGIQMAVGLLHKSDQANQAIIEPGQQQVVNDCQNVALAWLASQLGPEKANMVLRNLISCKVNRECPLVFHEPSTVAKACACTDMPSNVTCCTALNHYLLELQRQMLITNLQALHCVTILASILQNMSVSANIYSLCQIQLNDFSLQGCLLSSLPSDIERNVSGIEFTCDLNDNIAAPWPPPAFDSFALCSQAPVALPALPGVNGAYMYKGFRQRSLLLLVVFLFLILHRC